MHAGMNALTAKTDSRAEPRFPGGAAGKEPLQVRIPTNVKRAFKSQAALRGMEPNELFVEVWEYYERTRHEATGGKSR